MLHVRTSWAPSGEAGITMTALPTPWYGSREGPMASKYDPYKDPSWSLAVGLAKVLFWVTIGIVVLPFKLAWWLYKNTKGTPLDISLESRLEHTLITAGSGHGKTQALQHFLRWD